MNRMTLVRRHDARDGNGDGGGGAYRPNARSGSNPAGVGWMTEPIEIRLGLNRSPNGWYWIVTHVRAVRIALIVLVLATMISIVLL